MTKTPSIDSILPIINSVQQILAERAAQPRTVVPAPKPPTGHGSSDGMEIAQRVAERFLAQQGERIQRGASAGEISETLLTLLLEEGGRAGRASNKQTQLHELLTTLRQTSHSLGAALDSVGVTIRRLGFGYQPTLLDLRAELARLLGELAPGTTIEQAAAALARLASSGQLEPWRAALFAWWLKRKQTVGLIPPGDEELEALMTDADALAELAGAGSGPWEAYTAQATALLAHRRLGHALVEIEEETSRGR